MFRKWRERFELVEIVAGVSDGLGGKLPPNQETIQSFMGVMLPVDTEITSVEQGIVSSTTFSLITPAHFDVNILEGRFLMQHENKTYEILDIRDFKRMRRLTVRLIHG